MPRLHWEDFTPGQVTDCGSRVVTRAEIVAFAAEYDPQPMHLDEQAASATLLGGLVASGWHSCCILMRMLTDNLLVDASFMGAPGVEEVRWLAPLRPGERVTLRATVLETRASRSRAAQSPNLRPRHGVTRSSPQASDTALRHSAGQIEGLDCRWLMPD